VRPLADLKAARQTALQLLARRDYSCGELESKLCSRGVEPAVATELVEALRRERLVDDTRYVEHFVAYHVGRGQGPIRIERELKALKVDSELIERFLEQGQDWAARAKDVRRKKFGRAPPASYAEKAKQARFLQYRGFTGSQIRSALGSDIDIDDES
jgi:regulatory protein